jgi:arylsulfatase A-like enzyme
MDLTRRNLLQSAAAAPLSGAGNRPNVLFVMTDQQRFDCLGANGNSNIRTPNLDRLAAQSVNFQNAFVQAPVCVPSRVSYFTGRYPHSHKNRVNYTPCDGREVFLQQMLSRAGYRTGSVGKLHYYPPTADHARSTGWDTVYLDDGVPRTDAYSDYVKWRQAHDPNAAVDYNTLSPARNPFRAALPYEYTHAAWTGLHTRKVLREFAADSKPFFLFSSFFDPHSPYLAPQPFDAMYDDVELPLPREVSLDDIRKLPQPLQKQILRFKPEYGMPRARLEWIYRSYYAMVSMVDREVGGILDALERSGKAANTIVVFASDHGDQLLEHGLVGKNVFFESSIHVPFLVRWPGRVAPARRSELIETVDLAPTLLDLCGLAAPDRVQGRSLAPLLAGAPYTTREMVFAENAIPEVITANSMEYAYWPGKGVAGIRHPDAKMVRTARWKLTHYPGHGGELYDLKNDPGETRNLYSDPEASHTVRDLQGALLDWMIVADETDQIAPKWLP